MFQAADAALIRAASYPRDLTLPEPGALAVGAEYMYPFRRVTVQNRAVGRAGFAGCVRCPSRRRGAGGLGRLTM
jgi:hypothetical protein